MFNIFNAPRDYPSIYEPYLEELDFYDGRDSWIASIEKIPVKAVHLFSIHWLHLEVCNGGFWQYFYNSASNAYPEAVEGFKEIGMPKVVDVLTMAASKLGSEFPYDRELRKDIVKEPSNRMNFEEEDSKFYELADTDKFLKKEPKFVKFAEAYAKNT